MFGQCVVVSAAHKYQPLNSLGIGGCRIAQHRLECGSCDIETILEIIVNKEMIEMPVPGDISDSEEAAAGSL
jgi:hypothetical protein